MLYKIMDMHILLYAMAGVGVLGILGMAAVCLSYKRRVRKDSKSQDLKEKWLRYWGCRDERMSRMNRWVWLPSLVSTFLLCLAVVFSRVVLRTGMVSSIYIRAGLIIPLVLLVMRQALDFSYKEEHIFRSMAEYVEESCRQAANVQAMAAVSREQEDAMVDHVAGGIKESTGEKGRFGELLSPEEEEIMREVIREFMG